MARDELPSAAGEKPVRLRVLDLAARHRVDDGGEIVRIHLVVRRHDAGDVDLLVERASVAGDDRGPHALVTVVLDQLDAPVDEPPDGVPCPVLRGVVDDDDAIDEFGDAGERRPDQRLLVVSGNHDRDGLPLQH